jgi:hypothetical protein
MFRQSTNHRVHSASSTRKALRLIYYPSTLAQWLFFISDNNEHPMSLLGLCSVKVLFLIIPRVLTHRLHETLR